MTSDFSRCVKHLHTCKWRLFMLYNIQCLRQQCTVLSKEHDVMMMSVSLGYHTSVHHYYQHYIDATLDFVLLLFMPCCHPHALCYTVSLRDFIA